MTPSDFPAAPVLALSYLGDLGWGILTALSIAGAVALFRGAKARGIELEGLWRLLVSALGIAALCLILWKFLVKGLDGGSSGGMLGSLAVAMISVGSAAGLGLLLAALWGDRLIGLFADRIGSLWVGSNEVAEPEPFYARAVAYTKRGRYEDAIAEIQNELERFPDDLKGVLMMAEIHAEKLNDMQTAEQLLLAWVDSNGADPGRVSVCLQRLADWHLRLRNDPAAARELLARIPAAFPGTEVAMLAEQRLAHLEPGSVAAARDRTPIVVPKSDDRLGLRGERVDFSPPEADPAETAGRLVEHLRDHPHNAEAREELAKVYAEHYRRLDLAEDQIRALVEMPGVQPRQVVRWLNMMVDLHAHWGGDLEKATAALEEIVSRYPRGAAADAALNRKARLKLELRRNIKGQVVRLSPPV